jgi:hypothetical protein
VIPDDAPDRPLTPGEQAVIADLERRLLLDTPPAWDRGGTRAAVARPVRSQLAGSRRVASPVATSALPLVTLLGVACLLVALLAVAGGGLLGSAAVLGSVVTTALVWPLLPTALGGPVRPRRPPYRSPR